MNIAQKMPEAIKAPLRSARNMSRIPSSYMRLHWPKEPLKLHLGCGNKRLDGFVNIDMNWSAATDYRCDISKLPCPDGSVTRIETYHVIEHIPRPQAERVLGEWYRVLAPGGVLVLECPDFGKDIEQLLAGNHDIMYSIFGWQRFPGDAHHWGYTKETLSALVRQVGFSSVSTPPAQDYHASQEPCLRVEAVK